MGPLEQELRELLKSEWADPAPASPDEMFMFLITRLNRMETGTYRLAAEIDRMGESASASA